MLNYVFLVDPRPDQIRQITTLYRMAGWWTDQDDDPELVTRIIAGSHCFMIVSKGDAIIAMGRAISDKASDAYIQDVIVNNAYQGQGIGSRIIRKLITRLHNDGLNWIGLIAERGSHGFYERLGFKMMIDSEPMLLKS